MPGLPWIVNLVPQPESDSVKLLNPIRVSLRDNDTYINPASIRIMAAYSKLFSNGANFFDKELPFTFRTPLLSTTGTEPLISKTVSGVKIKKLTSNPERSIFVTSINSDIGFKSVILTVKVKPGTITPFDEVLLSTGPFNPSVFPGPLFPVPYTIGAEIPALNSGGVIIGIENGPRNKVIYLFLQESVATGPIIRISSYLPDTISAPIIDSIIPFDWSDFSRYTILWNEVESFVEVYARSVDVDTRIFRTSISSVPDMPSEYSFRIGQVNKFTAIYGLLGVSGDDCTISNFAFTNAVDYPILGNIRSGEYVTNILGSEFIKASGTSDPRDTDITTWIVAPQTIIANPDSEATSSSTNGIFSIIKPTVGKTFALYREEPGLLSSDNEGFMVQASIFSVNITQDISATGTGIIIFDGQSVFQLQLFNDFAIKTIGLLKKSGEDNNSSNYFLPLPSINWGAGHTFRFVVDPRRNAIRLYDEDNLGIPILDIPFDRSTLPSASDKGWISFTPFIAIGHILETSSNGTFNLIDFGICHLYQAWDSSDSNLPIDANPAFTRTTSGGSSSVLTSNGDLSITAPIGAIDNFHRTIEFGDHRGGILEVRARIESWRRFTRTGTYFLLDDGLRTFALTFIENNSGKFVVISQRSDLGGFQEIITRDGESSKLSFLIDWTEYHTYKLERLPYDGFKVYLDNETTPRLVYPENKLPRLPDTQFSGNPTLAFGQFSGEGAISRWDFVRGLFSRGYEISFKKNKPDNILKTDLTKTQAIIVAHIQDTDV